jgi:hypothetical protein
MIKNDSGMSSIDELVRNDHKDLLSCVYDKVKFIDRDLTLPGGFSILHLAAGQS